MQMIRPIVRKQDLSQNLKFQLQIQHARKMARLSSASVAKVRRPAPVVPNLDTDIPETQQLPETRRKLYDTQGRFRVYKALTEHSPSHELLSLGLITSSEVQLFVMTLHQPHEIPQMLNCKHSRPEPADLHRDASISFLFAGPQTSLGWVSLPPVL